MQNHKIATLDSIMGVADRPEALELVPEWANEESPEGQWIRLMGLSATEAGRYESSLVKLTTGGVVPDPMAAQRYKLQLVASCIVDEKGERIFADNALTKLGEKSGAVIDRLYLACRKLSGLDAEETRAIEGE